MSYTPIQQHFLGCSIRNFSLNIGWADTSTKLNVGLVEDDALDERFDGFVSRLVRFQYDSWIFDGILTNIREQKSDSGNRLWEVTISDPRELLSGIQLIIGGYTGFTYNVPNLYNIYGYLESFGFGNSRINDSGIPWQFIRNGFTQLNQITPVFFAGYPYYVDLTNLPDIPQDYRISGTNISLLDFIQEICSLANHEFTVVMTGNYITVLTVNRNVEQLNGSIYRLLATLPQYSSMESGFDLEYSVSNKFLVGGQVEQIYFQTNNIGEDLEDGSNPIQDDTIARYWGNDFNNNVIIAQRENKPEFLLHPDGTPITTPNGRKIPNPDRQNNNESFFLDGRAFSVPGVEWHQYPTDLRELEAALDSRTSWEGFISKYRREPFYSFKDGEWVDITTDKNVNHIVNSIHYGKANRLEMPPDLRMNVLRDKNIQNLSPKDLIKLERNAIIKSNFEEYITQVYEYLYNYANEYLGKKFMVRIPNIVAKRNEDGTITTSLAPTESGYIEESLIDNAVANGLIPSDDIFFTEENKIECFVKFGPYNFKELDLSELTQDDYYISNNALFLRATLEPDLVFLNSSTAYSPRVVITLPGRVRLTNLTESLSLIEFEYVYGSLDYSNLDWESQVRQRRNEFNQWKNQVGADTLFIDSSGITLIPTMAAIPLIDNTQTYGPWYTQGAQGKVEFVQDETMVPWNFGGFANMNLAGQAAVRDVFTNTMVGEAGSVEVPGSPLFNIAHQIFSNGPVITNIETSVGENGIVTSYRMERWNQRYGEAERYRIEQFKKNVALKRQNHKRLRSLSKPKKPIFNKFRIGSLLDKKPRRLQHKTSHPVIMSTVYDKENEFKGSNTAAVPLYQIPNILDIENWEDVAGCSLDGLFVPFSTDKTLISGSMPHFEEPESSGKNVDTLNPYKPGHNIGVVVKGAGKDGHTSINIGDEGDEDVYRSIALRSPLVLAGWGYDKSGNPVPSNEDGDDFDEDYLQDQTKWKVGPLDCRWDDDKKVWVAGSSIDKYIRDLRISTSGVYKLFEYELVEDGEAEWKLWFKAKGC